MKNDRNVIGRWSDPYLDSVELLYGAFDLHPNLTVAEVCEEWQECFRADSQGQVEAEHSEAAREWAQSYLNALEALYGEIDLHPALTIEELGEEWQECFRADGKVQSAMDRRQATKEWCDSYVAMWPLQPAS